MALRIKKARKTIIKHHKIFDAVTKHLNNTNIIIDIGCAFGENLVTFNKLDFQKYIGIDSNIEAHNMAFQSYLYEVLNYPEGDIKGTSDDEWYDLQSLNLEDWLLEESFSEYYKEFKLKYFFLIDDVKGDIRNYKLKELFFDLIIFSNVLHFIEVEKAISKIMPKIYDGLTLGGICYLSFKSLSKVKKLTSEWELLNNKLKYEKVDEASYKRLGNINESEVYHLYSEADIAAVKEVFDDVILLDDSKGSSSVHFIGKKYI